MSTITKALLLSLFWLAIASIWALMVNYFFGWDVEKHSVAFLVGVALFNSLLRKEDERD